MTSSDHNAPKQTDGSAAYSPLILRYFYNVWVLWLSNSYAWCCSTKSVLLPLFRSCMGVKHMDIGVGTGYYPAASLEQGARCTELTLVDLNPNSLQAAKRQVQSVGRSDLRVKTVVASATERLPLGADVKFDSVSAFYLLHCLEGPPEAKCRVFDAVRPHLAADGVFVGSTVLGREVPINWFGRKLMEHYNSKLKSFDNWKDSQKIFEQGLSRNFEHVETWVVGQVMLFRATKPRVETIA